MIEEAIKTIGGAHSGLSALISTRLYDGQAPQGAALPYVEFTKTDWQPVAGVQVNSGWGHSRVTFSAHAATLLAAKQVMLQVRAAFDRYHGTASGVAIDAVGTLATGEGGEDYDYELDHHLVDEEIEFFHTE